jgi:membrane protein YqaA with SNARE-associated domain
VLYLAAFAVVLAVNLLPAFGPPTWAVLVLLKLTWDLDPVALVLLGATAAGTGRYLLAKDSFRMRRHLGDKRRANLAAAKELLTGNRAGAVAGVSLFALSPVPSAQLFVAAGVLGLPVLPLAVAFFAGRLVSYSLYVSAATWAERSLGDVLRQSLTSPWGIALQVLLLAGIVALAQVDWQRLVDRRDARRAAR